MDMFTVVTRAYETRGDMTQRLMHAAEAPTQEMWELAPALLRDFTAAGTVGTLQWHRDAARVLTESGMSRREAARLAGTSHKGYVELVTKRAPGLSHAPAPSPPAPTKPAEKMLREAITALANVSIARFEALPSPKKEKGFDAAAVASWLAAEHLTMTDYLVVSRGLAALCMAGYSVADLARLMSVSPAIMSARLSLVPGARPQDGLIPA